MGTVVIPLGQKTATANSISSGSSVSCFRRALPVCASTLFQMNAILSSSPVNLARLIAVVGNDPGMTANLLRETAAADREAACDQLLDAIVDIGIRRLQAMLLRTPLMTGHEAHSASYVAWRNHSELTAVVAESIARTCGGLVAARARVGGLLHDIGKLPLLLSHAAQASATEAVWSDVPEVADGEVSHCDVGYELAQAWGFSSTLCQCIREHHTNEAVGRECVLAVVIAADRVCHRCGVTLNAEMARTYGDMPLREILCEALPWQDAQKVEAAAGQVRRAYEMWQRSHPNSSFVKI